MAAEALPVQLACRVLGVSESGYYEWRPGTVGAGDPPRLADRPDPPGPRRLPRHLRLPAGPGRAHPGPRYRGRPLRGRAADAPGRASAGSSGRPHFRRMPNVATASDLVERHSPVTTRTSSGSPTSPSTPPGRARSTARRPRRLPGGSSAGRSTRRPTSGARHQRPGHGHRAAAARTGTVIHSDQGTQFTSWAFTRRALDSGLLPSMGSVGDCYDNAMIESFWSRMQVELLDRQALADPRRARQRDLRLPRDLPQPPAPSHSAWHALLRSSSRLDVQRRQWHESSDTTPPKPGQARVSMKPGAVQTVQ